MTSGKTLLALLALLLGLQAAAAAPAACAWRAVAADSPRAFDQVQFIDTRTAWAHDAECLWTTRNSGRHWQAVSCADRGAADWRERSAIDRMHFIGEREGWLLTAGGTLRRTTDGGASWQDQSFPGHLPHALRFVDAQHGWWVGEQALPGVPDARGAIFATGDGGATWQAQDPGVAARTRWRLVAVWPRSPREAWALGSDVLLQTLDGGQRWRDRSPAALGRLRNTAIRFFDGDVGVIERSPASEVLVTLDGGQHWQVRRLPRSAPVLDGLVFTDARQAWVAIAGGLHRSADAGRSWTAENPGAGQALSATGEPPAYASLQYLPRERTLVAAAGSAGFVFCRLP